jgi:hypothetical protein
MVDAVPPAMALPPPRLEQRMTIPAHQRPQMVVDTPRYPAHEPSVRRAQPAPRMVQETSTRVRVVNQGPRYDVDTSASYVVGQGAAHVRPGVVVISGPAYAEVGVVPAYPYIRPDPAWKLCQIDRRQLGPAYYVCGPYSYHPYGEYGYRPYGEYRPPAGTAAYLVAPSARIINIESDD